MSHMWVIFFIFILSTCITFSFNRGRKSLLRQFGSHKNNSSFSGQRHIISFNSLIVEMSETFTESDPTTPNEYWLIQNNFFYFDESHPTEGLYQDYIRMVVTHFSCHKISIKINKWMNKIKGWVASLTSSKKVFDVDGTKMYQNWPV